MKQQFNVQFKEHCVFLVKNSGVKHKKFSNDKPLSIAEMMRRAQNGIPLSVYQPKNDNIPLNNRFYNDDFDVLDLAIKNDKRFAEEERKRLLEENAKRKAEIDKFEAWKREQALKAKEKATYVEKQES